MKGNSNNKQPPQKHTAARGARVQELSPLDLDTDAGACPQLYSATSLTSPQAPGAGKRIPGWPGGRPHRGALDITQNRACSAKHSDKGHTGWGLDKDGPTLLPRPFTSVTANRVTSFLEPGPEPSAGGDRRPAG